MRSMSDSLIDEALGFCQEALLDLPDTPERRQLRARLGVLERAAWSLTHQVATQLHVVNIAKLVLMLRDDVVALRAAPPPLGSSAEAKSACAS